jgi:hypothetical protein
MAYVCRNPPSQPIRLPKRRWNSGLGQCSTITNWLCGSSAIQSVMGTPCSQCAIPPPVLAPGSTSPGLPVGYDPNSGLVAPSNSSGDTSVNPYTVIYPSNPGGSTSLFGSCDMTQVDWTDPSTYCPGTWLLIGLGAIAAVLVAGSVRGKR